jgi:hypothetical protein
MIIYGMVKVIPVQRHYPALTRLLQPFGTLSPMGVLWTSMGSAPAYEIFAGCAQVAAALLLIVPRTATLGALISLADTILVFMLAMTYDVVAKLFAFHLILLCCFLLAPNVPRLVRFLSHTKRNSSVASGPADRRPRANHVGLWLIGVPATSPGCLEYRGAADRFGALWHLGGAQMSIDEQPRPPLLTDSTRWRRAILITPTGWPFSDDESFAHMAPRSISRRELALTKSDDQN